MYLQVDSSICLLWGHFVHDWRLQWKQPLCAFSPYFALLLKGTLVSRDDKTHKAVRTQLTHDTKAALPNTYNALVYVTFCVGSYLFTLGCFLMTVPVINEASSSHLRL